MNLSAVDFQYELYRTALIISAVNKTFYIYSTHKNENERV